MHARIHTFTLVNGHFEEEICLVWSVETTEKELS